MPRNLEQQASKQDNSSQANQEARLFEWKSWGTLLVIEGATLVLIIGTMFIAGSYLLLPSIYSTILREIGIALVTGTVATIFVSVFITRYPKKVQEGLSTFLEEEVREKLAGLQERIEDQTKEQAAVLLGYSDSMRVLDSAGITRVYKKRSDAVDDMIQDLQDQVTHIRIMGVSLTDLVTRQDAQLNKVWDKITEYVKHGGDYVLPRDARLNIRVLIVDPECMGAQLRSWWESKETLRPSSLLSDVKLTAQTLQQLMKTIPVSQTAQVSLEVHLYRLPPQLFLLSTDKVSYVEPYYFWKAKPPQEMPLFKLTHAHNSRLQQGTIDHFDLIWEQASIPLEQFLADDQVGLDKGMYESGAINVYDDMSKTRKRMKRLLRHAEKRVYIQGISLNSTFGIGESQADDLIPLLRALIERGVEVKILLLDPESDQAKFRAFREWYLQERRPDKTFEQYRQELLSQHDYEKLYWDTNRTIQRLARLQQDLLDQNEEHDTFGFKLYDAAPCCFMFLVDDTVLVEQYIYGIVASDRHNGHGPTILGGEMPLVEYASQPTDLYEARPERHVFEMMKDHFNFVFHHYAHPIKSPVKANFEGRHHIKLPLLSAKSTHP